MGVKESIMPWLWHSERGIFYNHRSQPSFESPISIDKTSKREVDVTMEKSSSGVRTTLFGTVRLDDRLVPQPPFYR
ncbi:hypothetical protein OIU77_025287 [Salix suchowensis]|uniref:Uncharacterized protein n=1 Tax=Salix suchowensis TaxID=1278906 RepID=A0ABQ9BVR7_9ROSI|nr:hypothetical protein OIU77_025287 [Salix suchowensis]